MKTRPIAVVQPVAVERKLSDMTKFEKFIAVLDMNIASLEKDFTKFAHELAADPAYALAWSNDKFAQAGELAISQWTRVKLIEGNSSPAQLVEYMTEQVMNAAKYPKQSTSQPSNMMEHSRTAAMVVMIEKLQRLVD